MEKIKLVIADDMEEIRIHLAEEIAAHSDDIVVVGQAATGHEAFIMAERLLPSVVLMDIQMESRTSGITAIG